MAAAALLPALIQADEYFTGDGTAYTLGQLSAGNCNMMMSGFSLASTNYAAINSEQWDELANCGRCAEVSCADDKCADQSTSVVVQILDQCPECKYGDLDLSPTVFETITGSSPARYAIKWKFVDCPIAGNVNVCLKSGSNAYWTAVQPANVRTGVASLSINGAATTMLGSAYYYLLDGQSTSQTDLSSVTVSITDVYGQTIEETVSLSDGECTEGSSQFPASSGSSTSTYSKQQPTATTPTPTTAAPTSAPATTSPAPATTSPAPTTEAPAPTTEAPTTAPVTQAPEPTASSSSQESVSPAATVSAYTPAPETDSPVPSLSPVSPTLTPTSTPEPTSTPPSSTPEPAFTDASSAQSETQNEEENTGLSINANASVAISGSESTETTPTPTTKKPATETPTTYSSSVYSDADDTEHTTQSTTTDAPTSTPSTDQDQQTVSAPSTSSSSGAQEANTQASDASSSPLLVIGSVGGALAAVVVAVIAIVAVQKKKKALNEQKAGEGDDTMMTRSFDLQRMSTPAESAVAGHNQPYRSDFAIL